MNTGLLVTSFGKIGFDTAENAPSIVGNIWQHLPSLHTPSPRPPGPIAPRSTAEVLGDPVETLTEEEVAEIHLVVDIRNEGRAQFGDIVEKDIVKLVQSYLGVKDATSYDDLCRLLLLQESLVPMKEIQNMKERLRDLWDDDRKRIRPFEYARRWNMWREQRIFEGTARGQAQRVKKARTHAKFVTAVKAVEVMNACGADLAAKPRRASVRGDEDLADIEARRSAKSAGAGNDGGDA